MEKGTESSSAIIADTHLIVPEMDSEASFPIQIERVGRHSMGEAEQLYESMRAGSEAAYEKTIDYLNENSPHDRIFHLGDVTSGYKNSGMANDSSKQLARKVREDLEKISSNVHFALGNHDLGYKDVGRGDKSRTLPSYDSIATAQEIFGKLYWSEEDSGVTHLGVCSPIEEYNGTDENIIRLKADQESFVKEVMTDTKGDINLYIHRPNSVKLFQDSIEPHSEKVREMFYGDVHSPMGEKTFQITSALRGGFMKEMASKSTLCPSVIPAWWGGEHLLEIQSNDDENKVTTVDLSNYGAKTNMPSASFLRSLYWCIPSPFK
jgi:hypothetical protein